MRHLVAAVALALALVAAVFAQSKDARHAMRGMVLSVDAARKTVVVSHDSIPNVMPAMTMPFEVRNSRELEGLVPGAIVSFALVVSKESAYAEGLRIIRYESVEQDPLAARRLRLLQQMTGAAVTPLTVGQAVPDFTLTDQARARVSLSQFRGKVVALNFVYTSCVLPQFCYRLANHFSVVQRRFQARMGRDLVLFTVTFDPARDTPERLAEYARQWSADRSVWHFLTGGAEEVRQVCRLFGLDAFPDEGLISHSTRTVVIDQRGALAASIEGNQHTAAQLGDLIAAVLDR
ncbi:MAG TPA: SCO family protein [Vicinamibacterales bacterium]|jgi:protein SCO1/2|nr:SCO family protein [Vicinamibacterales bacterium]